MKLKKYQKENAKLRKQILQLKLDWESERDYANQMEAKEKKVLFENAKLRKAARDAWFLFVKFGAVHPYNLPEVDEVRELLQELGIEVK